MTRSLFVLTAAAALSLPALADEKLKGIACRSVHLGYPAPEGTAFYNEVTVEKSADGTYFMACGWGKGYFGIQELANGKKVVIFSVWDPAAGDDPKKVAAGEAGQDAPQGRTACGSGGSAARAPAGSRSSTTTGRPARRTASWSPPKPDGNDRTAYTGHFYLPEKKEWKHLVTFSTLTEGRAAEAGTTRSSRTSGGTRCRRRRCGRRSSATGG